MTTYNCWELTRNCLGSLLPTLPESCELLIVDNASADQTRAELAKMKDQIRYFPQDVNIGFAAANNFAVTQSMGDTLFFINNDLIFRQGWWQPMTEILYSYPKSGVVGNVHWNPRTGHFDHMGIIFDGAQPIHFGEQFIFRPFRGATRWGAVTAACWAIKHDVFLEAGGFDVSFTNGYEDVDLCLRLGERGFHHFVANESIISHFVSSSPGRHDSTQANAHLFDSRWKNRLATTWSLWDERVVGWNYLLQLAMNPLIFNRHNLLKALKRTFLCHPQARKLREIRARNEDLSVLPLDTN